MPVRAPWTTFLAVGIASLTRPAVAQVDQQRAQEYFREARALCELDGGRHWGVSVCAPMVIGDARTQTYATSQTPPDAPRPRAIGFVNAPVQWGGTTWIALNWTDLANAPPRRRNEIILHEMFHGIQQGLGLRVGILENEHLDALEGRYWLELEWRALARALRTSGVERTAAVRDALSFRQARRRVYPAMVENERGLEINEGIASYAGTVLVAESNADAVESARTILATAEAGESFVRNFAYVSGPAYGVLLDAAAPGWHRAVKGSDDLGILLMAAFAIEPAIDAAAVAAGYDPGGALRAAEEQREQRRVSRINELRARFVDGPVLVLPGGGRGMSDSRGATVIPGIGTVYFHAYSSTGEWGTLDAEKGVLLGSDGRSRRVPAPVPRDDGTLTGDGWTFKPGAGWVVREGPRKGDYEVVRQQPDPPAVARDVGYGREDGQALTLDVFRPARPNGAGVIAIVSGGWYSNVEISRAIVDSWLAPLLTARGFTVFAVRHRSSPKYPMSAIVADVRRAVRFIRQHAGEYGVEHRRLGVYGGSAGGHLALLLGTTADSGNPAASDAVLRVSSRVAAIVAFFPPTDLVRWENRRSFPASVLPEAEAARYSPIRFVSPASAPSLIVHGTADTVVPIIEGETMYAALARAGVPASLLRIEGAGHAFVGADRERVIAAMVQWFEQHLLGPRGG